MENNEKIKIDWPVFGISGGVLVLFTAIALFNVEFAKTVVNKSFAFSCTYFGAYWQVLLLLVLLKRESRLRPVRSFESYQLEPASLH